MLKIRLSVSTNRPKWLTTLFICDGRSLFLCFCRTVKGMVAFMNYDVIIIGAGPGGIFSAYELAERAPQLKIAVFEAGHALNKRKCPIDGDKIKTCIGCKSCSIMSGFGGAGAFSDGKYNITNDFGGTLYE